MTVPANLAKTVGLAFKQALQARELDVAELLLQALERLETESRCEAVMEDAWVMIDDRGRRTPRSKRSVH